MGRYAIFNGLVYGGGTNVIPNPEGTPTEELHSIQIDEDIYEIVGGGGSGGNASLDAITLYDTPITTTGTYTLTDDYNNYDFIGFKAGNGSTETDIRLYAVKDIQDSMNDNLVITNNVTNSWFNFTMNENELTIPGKTVSTIYSVIGYKIKGGGGSTDKVTKVYDIVPSGEGCSIVVAEHIWLSDSGGSVSYSTAEYPDITSVDNFIARLTQTAMDDGSRDYDINITFTFDDTNKTIEMSWGTLSGSSGCYVDIVYSLVEPVVVASDVEVSNTNTVTYDISSIVPAYQTLASKDFMFNLKHIYSDNDGLGTSSPFNINFNSNTGVLTVSWNDIGTNNVLTGDILLLYKEDGYKLIKDMQPPTETSSGYHGYVPAPKIGDENKFLRGDGTWSEVGGGSQELISYDTTITTTQYGWWTAEDKDGNVLDPDQYELIAVTPIVNNSSSWVGAWDGAFYVNSVDGTTYRYDVTFVNINDGGYIRTSRTWDVKVVYRDKNAAGGGGGSTVVPNPEEEPTDTLNTIEIDGVVYNIEGGSEGEGVEIYSQDEYIVGKWIDGKKLYQKTFYYTHNDTIGDGYTTIASLSDADYFEFVECSLYNPTDKRSYALSYAYGSNTTALTYDNGDIKLRINNDTWNANWDVVVTVRYTKTVETPAPAWGGSVTNNYANFIDTSNVIDSGVYNPTTPLSYTAAEDCFMVIVLIANNNPCIVSVDNKEIYRLYDNGVGSITAPIPLKKGQTITATTSYSTEDSPYTVYGITYASGGSDSGSSKIEYSTEEKEVGTWIDGSKIYERTWNFSSPLSITSGSWSDTSIAVADTDIYIIVNCEAISNSGARWTFVSATTDLATTTYVRLLNTRSADVNVKYLTLWYTKTVS